MIKEKIVLVNEKILWAVAGAILVLHLPRDAEYLLELPRFVRHFEILANEPPEIRD